MLISKHLYCISKFHSLLFSYCFISFVRKVSVSLYIFCFTFAILAGIFIIEKFSIFFSIHIIILQSLSFGILFWINISALNNFYENRDDCFLKNDSILTLSFMKTTDTFIYLLFVTNNNSLDVLWNLECDWCRQLMGNFPAREVNALNIQFDNRRLIIFSLNFIYAYLRFNTNKHCFCIQISKLLNKWSERKRLYLNFSAIW